MNFNLNGDEININNISDFVLRYITNNDDSDSNSNSDATSIAIDIQLRTLDSVILGLAYMEIFCQMNYIYMI